MKTKLFYLLLLTIALVSCGDDDEFLTDCLPDNLKNEVIAFYPFDQGSLQDRSGNGNHLINGTTAAAAADRAGNSNCAFGFKKGKGEFLKNSNTDFLNGLGDFSLSMWYLPQDTLRDGGEYETLIGRGESSDCSNRRAEWSLGLFDCRRAVFGHNAYVWADLVTASSPSIDCQGEVNALTGNWQHVVVVRQKDNFKIYFNGLLNDSSDSNNECLAQDKGDLFLGKDFNGSMDDVIIYARALNASEAMELFDLNTCCK